MAENECEVCEDASSESDDGGEVDFLSMDGLSDYL